MSINLAEEIRRAHSKNEARIAAEVATPKSELDTEAQLHLHHFAEFCKSRGVLGLPARPATCAMFVRVQHANGVPTERILAALAAVENVHWDHNLASPVASKQVRAELARILNTPAPRSWKKEEQLLFLTLPP